MLYCNYSKLWRHLVAVGYCYYPFPRLLAGSDGGVGNTAAVGYAGLA